jgi:hypothetical protein
VKTLSTVLLVLLVVSLASSQQTWIRTYGGRYDDVGYSVQQTSDGGYAVAGMTFTYGEIHGNVYLIKTNASGDTLWARYYGGFKQDWGWSVQQTSDGGYVVAGHTYSFGDSLYENVYLIKTNAAGETIWTRNYGGTGIDDAGYSVRQTSDGGYVVTGVTNGSVYLIKTNASGDTLWTRTYGGSNYAEGQSVEQTTDEGYIIAGYTHFGSNGNDVYLVKTNAAGDTLWTRRYGGTGDDVGYSVQQTTDGGYIIAGQTKSFGAGGYDVYLIKTDSLGHSLWAKPYGGTKDDVGRSVQQTTDGGYIVTGQTRSFGADSGDVYLVRTNASGDTLWTRTYGGTGDDAGNSVQQTSDGGYIVAGWTTRIGGPGDYDVYLIKTDADGKAGIEETGSSKPRVVGSLNATPNPFASFTRIPGHEAERLNLYDISGKLVGTYPGNRIGEGLSPAVYFVRLEGRHGGSLRVVKTR